MLHKGFSQAWYQNGPYLNTFYRGNSIVKCPLDLFMYQEIIWQTRPDLIVETGTHAGGSAVFLADQLDLMVQHEGLRDDAGLVTVDINTGVDLPAHPRVTYVEGWSSVDLRTLEYVQSRAEKADRVMVILDSDHSQPHVLKELRAYHEFVSPGCYLIVEDTNPDAYTAMEAQNYDPAKGFASHAVKNWNPEKHGFSVDDRRERLLFTQNPGGYLKKRTKETG